jgi:acyl carrier protein
VDAHDLVTTAIGRLNASGRARVLVPDDPDAALFGVGSALDSLDLVNLIAMVEAEIRERTGVSVTLASEEAFLRPVNPFSSVAAFTDYVDELLVVHR